MIVKDKDRKEYELSKYYDKGMFKGIRYSEMYYQLMKDLVLIKTTDNCYFTIDLQTLPIQSTMYFHHCKNELEVNHDNFIKYWMNKNKNLMSYDKWYLVKEYNEKNDNLVIYMISHKEQDGIVRELTDLETKEVNDILDKARNKYLKRLERYWDRYGSSVSTFSFLDTK